MRRVRALLLASLLCVTLLPSGALAATSTPWSRSGLPTSGDATVPAGRTVVLDRDLDVRVLRVAGTLTCADRPLAVRARAIVVEDGGTFACGTRARPHVRPLDITLTGGVDGDPAGYGARTLAVDGGLLSLHGRGRRSVRSLARTAAAGATTLRLDTARGLRRGDELVVASTDYAQDHSERVTVRSVSGDSVRIAQPLRWRHECTSARSGRRAVPICAEVGLLTHDITIHGPSDTVRTRVGASVMALGRGRLQLQGVELRDVGQAGRIGKYPLHWHLVGDARGQYVRSTSVVDSHNRFLSIHRTDGLLVRDVVGDVTVGHGFYLEDGSETDTRLVGNLGLRVADAEGADRITPSDAKASVFWISNPDNVVRDNAAVGGWAGYWCAFGDRAVGLSADEPDRPRTTAMARFQGNTAHSAGFAGVYLDGGERADRTTGTTWYEPHEDPTDLDSPVVRARLLDVTSYRNRHVGIWARVRNGIDVVRPLMADNWRALYLANFDKADDARPALVRGGLVVGESSVPAAAEPWETTGPGGRALPKPWEPDAAITGIHVYDGPVRVVGTRFADFVPRRQRDAAAIAGWFPNPFSVNAGNEFSRVRFERARRVWFHPVGQDGDDNTLLTDRDGSLTGRRGSVVAARGALLDDRTCRVRSRWNAAVCRAGHVQLYVIREDGTDADVTVRRATDGRSARYDGDDVSDVNLMTRRWHTVRFDHGVPDEFHVMEVSRTGGGATLLRVRVGARPQHVGFWRGGDEVGSRAALRSGGNEWFHDRRTGLLHVRLTSGGVTVDR